MKTCEKCQVEKPLDEFYRRRSNPDGRAKRCRACAVPHSQRTYAAKKRRIADDPEYAAKVREYGKAYRRRVKSEKYNVDVAQMEADQNGRCAGCGRTPDEVACEGVSGEVLHVDHDHTCCDGAFSCGECVRALLCKKCNSILGLADDDADRLLALAAYLLGHQTKTNMELMK
jgi:hypothetical protein